MSRGEHYTVNASRLLLGMTAKQRATVRRAARTFSVSVDDLLSSTRGSPQASVARHALMYSFHNHATTFTQVGRLLGRDRKTVSHGVAQTGLRLLDDKFFVLMHQVF